MNQAPLILSFLYLMIGVPLAGSETVPIVNRSGVVVDLWFWEASETRWTHPPLALLPQQTLVVDFSSGPYYLVARTRTQVPDEIALGWFAPAALKRRAPSVSLVINGTRTKKTKELAYTITKPVWETTTKDVAINRWFCENGRLCSRTEIVKQHSQTCKQVPEQRVQTVEFETVDLTASAQDANGPLLSQVTFRTAKPGAFVRYQLVGRDDVRNARNPTQTTEPVPVGIYLVWTERNQKASSFKRRYDIVDKALKITIPEISLVP